MKQIIASPAAPAAIGPYSQAVYLNGTLYVSGQLPVIPATGEMLADIADFGAMNAVYAEFFPNDKPARVCYQVAALPKGALVEIDAIAGK